MALGIAAFSQLTGINAMVYYAPPLLTDEGFGGSVALLTGIGIGVMPIQSLVWLLAPEKAAPRCAWPRDQPGHRHRLGLRPTHRADSADRDAARVRRVDFLSLPKE